MKLKKQALLYDIANMAYLTADTGEPHNHGLHRVRDICEEGNIDRVSRILGLAYSQVLTVLFPILQPPEININRENSSKPHDYEFIFRNDGDMRYRLSKEKQLYIKETVHEYMVCLVLADWLDVTFPEAADVWRYRVDKAMKVIRNSVEEILAGDANGFRRKLNPF